MCLFRAHLAWMWFPLLLLTVATSVGGSDSTAKLEVMEQWPFFSAGAWLVLALLVTVLTLASFLGFKKFSAMQERRIAQDAFARATLGLQETERKRIAAELHDGLGQNLLMIKNRAMLALKEPRDQENVETQLNEITKVASQSIEEIREIARNLRPYQLDRLGLTKAMRALVKKATQSSTIQFQEAIEAVDEQFTSESEINLYRILQEGLNNVVKHSEAKTARVELQRCNGEVVLTINDDGRGFDADVSSEGQTRQPGLGLSTMQERARIMSGRLTFRRNARRGTCVQLTVPTERESNDQRDQRSDRR